MFNKLNTRVIINTAKTHRFYLTHWTLSMLVITALGLYWG